MEPAVVPATGAVRGYGGEAVLISIIQIKKSRRVTAKRQNSSVRIATIGIQRKDF
jgi:hypothetical protein